jgi:hypothetical protein
MVEKIVNSVRLAAAVLSDPAVPRIETQLSNPLHQQSATFTMEIRWDIFAALVALASFPFMVNPTTLALVRRLYIFVVRLI